MEGYLYLTLDLNPLTEDRGVEVLEFVLDEEVGLVPNGCSRLGYDILGVFVLLYKVYVDLASHFADATDLTLYPDRFFEVEGDDSFDVVVEF